MQKVHEGKWNGGLAPYEYKLVDGKLEINEEEAEAISIIFEQYVNTDIDALDYEDKHYKRRKADLKDRLYKAYDKMDEIENALAGAKAKKRSIMADKVTGDNMVQK